MRNKSREPAHDLDEAKRLAESGDYFLARRAQSFVMDHYGTTGETVRAVFAAIEPRHFRKTVELKNRPGILADVYCGMVYDEIEWYVKFFMEDGVPMLDTWSMNWDGAVH